MCLNASHVCACIPSHKILRKPILVNIRGHPNMAGDF